MCDRSSSLRHPILFPVWYGSPSPRFFCLPRNPYKPWGYLDTAQQVQNSVNRALPAMNQMPAIGVNYKGFDRILSVQIVRPQLEYGLVICSLSLSGKHFEKVDSCQSKCIRQIFGGGTRSSITVMLHLVNQPTMKERVHILQAKFLLCSVMNATEETLLSQFLLYLQTSASSSQWYKLTKTPVWKRCTASLSAENLDTPTLNKIRQQYLEDNHQAKCSPTANSVIISAYRPKLGVEPLLWIPMTHAERSRALRCRLGWLPGGVSKPCIYHPNDIFTRTHAIRCLHMHSRLQMPLTKHANLSKLFLTDDLSYLPGESDGCYL